MKTLQQNRLLKLYKELKNAGNSDYDIICGYNNGELKILDWVGLGQNIAGVSASGSTWLMWDTEAKNPLDTIIELDANDGAEEDL